MFSNIQIVTVNINTYSISLCICISSTALSLKANILFQSFHFLEMYLPSGENEPWGKNKSLVICIIGLSCITVVMTVLHIGWCVVDVLFM